MGAQKTPAQIAGEWAERVECVCDLVGLPGEQRPAVRPDVYRFLRDLYLLRFERAGTRRAPMSEQ